MKLWNGTLPVPCRNPEATYFVPWGVNEMWPDLEVRIQAAVPFAPLLDGEELVWILLYLCFNIQCHVLVKSWISLRKVFGLRERVYVSVRNLCNTSN